MIGTIIEFWADENGATALDYARIGALAVVGLVGAYDVLGHVIEGGTDSVIAGLEAVAKEFL